MTEQTIAKTYESIAAAAARTGVHPNTIRNRIAEGRLPAYRFGSHMIRLVPAEVDAAMSPIPTTSARTA